MKFIGLSNGRRMTKDKVTAAVSVISVLLLCVLSFVGISALLEADAAAARNKHKEQITDLIEETDPSEETSEESSETADTSDISDTSATSATSESTADTEGSSTDTTASSETGETTETTKSTTKATTEATTKPTVTETTHNAIVYATKAVNLRKGPGTSYESIRVLHRGDEIDVIAVTSNGWYKTIKGNYVIASCTQSEKINTPTPKPTKKPATPTPKPTKKPTKKPTPTSKPAPNKDKLTLVGEFKVTFYIPFQGTTNASGTTCIMGQTVAASKYDFPLGTEIYIENDPLGQDGYYIVEDRGVSSGKIDIFVNTKSDIPSYGRTTRKVYIVNK